jgi:hypothetical protein
MTKQPEALRLAEILPNFGDGTPTVAAIELRRQDGEINSMRSERIGTEKELRRLHEVNVGLLFALDNLLKVNEGVGPTVYHAQYIARAAIAKATGETE